MNDGPPILTFKGGGQPMALLVNQISQLLNRRVVDRTGLTGLYDFELTYSMASSMPLATQAPGAAGATPTVPIDDGPTIFDAVREMALKLESERGPVEHLVIDRVERPSED